MKTGGVVRVEGFRPKMDIGQCIQRKFCLDQRVVWMRDVGEGGRIGLVRGGNPP